MAEQKTKRPAPNLRWRQIGQYREWTTMMPVLSTFGLRDDDTKAEIEAAVKFSHAHPDGCEVLKADQGAFGVLAVRFVLN